MLIDEAHSSQTGEAAKEMKKVLGGVATSSTPGTGLGLAIAYGVIKEHSGSSECKSGPDQGTRFTVSLPLPPRSETRSGAQG